MIFLTELQRVGFSVKRISPMTLDGKCDLAIFEVHFHFVAMCDPRDISPTPMSFRAIFYFSSVT